MKEFTFEKAKDKYESIKASDKLKMEVNNMFEKKNNFIKIASGMVATIAITFTVALNVNPVFASSVANNNFMKPIVKILTANKYEFNENNMYAKVVTPELKGITNKEIEDKINAEIEKMSNELISQFETESEDLKAADKDAHLGLESNYTIRTDNDSVLSVDIYVVNTVGSSSTIHRFYNIDKQTGEVITLKDKFQNDDNYLETISKYIENEMLATSNPEEGIVYFADYDEIYSLLSTKQQFYINESGNVVIVFDKYEVGPGSMGCPEFEINL